MLVRPFFKYDFDICICYFCYWLPTNGKWHEEGTCLFLAYFPYFLQTKAGLCDLHAVFVSMNPPYWLLNTWASFYETWYSCHGTWAQLKSVLHKSFSSVCVSLCVSLLSLLGKSSINCISPFLLGNGCVNLSQQQPIHATIEELLDARVCGSVCVFPYRCYTIKTFLWRGRIFGSIVFMRFVSYKRKLGIWVLPRTSYFSLIDYIIWNSENMKVIFAVWQTVVILLWWTLHYINRIECTFRN
jgi:hypothetical protein